jgi:hypothetical protein
MHIYLKQHYITIGRIISWGEYNIGSEFKVKANAPRIERMTQREYCR